MRRLLHREHGYSLTEVMVATLVMMLVMGALYASLDQAEVFYESYDSSITLRQESRVAMGLMSGELRAAGYDLGNVSEALSIAGGSQVQFSGDIDDGDTDSPCDASFENAAGGGAERVTYAVDDANNLVRSIDCFNGSSWTTGVDVSTILTGLQPGLQLFEYRDVSGMLLPLAGGLLPAGLRSDVRSIEISLVLQDADQTVSVRNDGPEWFRLVQHVRLNNLESLGDF